MSPPWFLAIFMYIARTTVAEAFMVIEVEISSSGMPSKSSAISSTVDMATPTFPTSPRAISWSES